MKSEAKTSNFLYQWQCCAACFTKLSPQWMSTINVCQPNSKQTQRKANQEKLVVVALEVTVHCLWYFFGALVTTTTTSSSTPFHTFVSVYFTATAEPYFSLFVCVHWNVYANAAAAGAAVDSQMNECSNATDSADVSFSLPLFLLASFSSFL